MTSRSDAQSYFGEATESVTDRVRSYGLSLLGASLLLSKDADQSLLEVELEGALAVSAGSAAAALCLDFLQFFYRAVFWGYQQRRATRNDLESVESPFIPLNLALISVIFFAKSAALVVSAACIAGALLAS